MHSETTQDTPMAQESWHELWQTLTRDDAGTTPVESGLVALDDLSALVFEGADAKQFLHGYLTCNTLEMTAGTMHGAALCNLQGRVVAFGWCGLTGKRQLTWLVHSSLRSEVEAFMKPYLAFSKTTLQAASHPLVLGRILTPDPDEEATLAELLEVILIQNTDQLQALWAQAGAGDADHFRRALIRAGIPWLSAPVSARFLPQMLNLAQLGVVDFDKGCYLGQEVVARAQHRGQVKRSLVALACTGMAELEPGSDLADATGATVGTIIQATPPVLGQSMALAVMRAGSNPPYAQQESRLRPID